MVLEMRQLTFIEPGKLRWEDVPDPVVQSNEEAIVAPTAVALCDLDRPVARGLYPIPGPFAFGHEFVGRIVEIGSAVRGFAIGDEVVVSFQISCGTCERCGRGATGNCLRANPGAMYGLGQIGGNWGGALSDLVRVPFANAMLFKVPDGVSPSSLAGAADNICDAYRTVGPFLERNDGADVLIVAGGAPSIALYAVDIARALGAGRVDYIDASPERLALAEKLGASVIEGAPPRKAGRYLVTVDASADTDGLLCAIRSTEPGGWCTSIGIYPTDVSMPLFEMYTRGITFITGRPDSIATLPKVLSLAAEHRIEPNVIATYLDWESGPEAIEAKDVKVILTRR